MQVVAPHVEHGKLWNIFDTSERLFFFSSSTFSVLSKNRQRLSGVRLSPWVAFRGRWHTGDESSCLNRCWGHTSQPPHVCEVSGMVLTSDARLQRTSSIRPPSLSQHTGGKQRSGLWAGQESSSTSTNKTFLNGPLCTTGKGSYPNCCHKVRRMLLSKTSLSAVALRFLLTVTKEPTSNHEKLPQTLCGDFGY